MREKKRQGSRRMVLVFKGTLEQKETKGMDMKENHSHLYLILILSKHIFQFGKK